MEKNDSILITKQPLPKNIFSDLSNYRSKIEYNSARNSIQVCDGSNKNDKSASFNVVYCTIKSREKPNVKNFEKMKESDPNKGQQKNRGTQLPGIECVRKGHLLTKYFYRYDIVKDRAQRKGHQNMNVLNSQNINVLNSQNMNVLNSLNMNRSRFVQQVDKGSTQNKHDDQSNNITQGINNNNNLGINDIGMMTKYKKLHPLNNIDNFDSRNKSNTRLSSNNYNNNNTKLNNNYSSLTSLKPLPLPISKVNNINRQSSLLTRNNKQSFINNNNNPCILQQQMREWQIIKRKNQYEVYKLRRKNDFLRMRSNFIVAEALNELIDKRERVLRDDKFQQLTG